MIRNVLAEIGGIGLYGLIAITLFFTAFIFMLVRVLLMNRRHCNAMRQLPLDDAQLSEQGDLSHD